MDVSKLPKLSQSDPPPKNDAADTSGADTHAAPRRAEAIDYRPTPPEPISGGEIWFSVIVGVIFILLGHNFAGYELSRMSGKPYHTGVNWTAGPNTGQEVAYPDLQGYVFWNDSAMFLIGVAVVLDALLRVVIAKGGAASRPLAYLGFGITILAPL